jgi:mannose-6-phosphate isomerase-like protein (cupin superfamily)
MIEKPTIKELAEFFIRALSAGVVETSQVARWADSIIAAEDKPSIEIIEVSLACNRNVHDTISCLHQIKGEMQPNTPINLMAAYLLKKLMRHEIELGNAIRALYRATREGMFSDFELEIAGIEDSWCLVEEGIYDNIENVKKRLEMFLEERRDYIAHLPIEWSSFKEENLNIININNTEHYTWGEDCDGWHLLKRDDVSIIQERVPPGRFEVKHLHKKARQFFYILSGEATMVSGDQRVRLRAFEGIEIPPGAIHQFRNDSNADVVFLVISSPKSHGDRENIVEEEKP